MERSITHIDMDTFYVSCERRQNAALKNLPLIIGGSSDRAVVASCSHEARVFGVRSAMPIRQAKKLCPQAKIISPDMDLYSICSKEVTQILEEKAPVMEKASIDEFYLDISGMDKFFGCYKWTSELTQKVFRETHLPVSFGLSVNKTVSKIATTEGKPQGKLNITQEMVRPFINPLSIRKIPGLGTEKYEELARSGIHLIGELSQVDKLLLQRMYGKDGISIWQKANGIDEAPVEPYVESKSISRSLTFDQDTIDISKVKSLLSAFVEKLSYELRSQGWLTSIVTVKIRYANFDNASKQKKISYTALDTTLIVVVKDLFDKLYDRRMRIRLVGVSFAGLLRSSMQINLFSNTIEEINLLESIDKLRNRFGFGAIMTAQTFSWYQQAIK